MRDRRDYLIAALAAALLFSLGLLVGQYAWMPAAAAQDAGDPDSRTIDGGDPTGPPPGGITINTQPSIRPGFDRGTVAATASDSDSNNRFVAVTCPVGSGESVLFLLDSKGEQVAVYRYRRNKGLEFLAGRKIDMDLRISGYQYHSEFSRDDMKRLYEKQRARAAAKAAEGK